MLLWANSRCRGGIPERTHSGLSGYVVRPVGICQHISENADSLPQGPPRRPTAAQAGNAFLARGARTTLRIDPLTQAGVTVGYTEDAVLNPQQGQAGRLHTVKLRMTGTAWQNAVALSWDTAPTQVYLTKTASLWKFSLGNRFAEFHWDTGEACAYLAGQASSCALCPIGPPGAPKLLQATP